jgi:hypothetical protein
MAAHPHAMALWFIHPPERDQGVARGSGDPPYWVCIKAAKNRKGGAEAPPFSDYNLD